MQIDVNYTAILIAAIAQMVLGFIWYGPLFGREWMKLVGMTEKDKEAAKSGMGKTYALSFLGSLVMSYVLAHFLRLAGAETAMTGAQGGFWVWLGFVATTGMNEFLWAVKPKPWKLYWINQSYILVGLLIAGAILATWR